MHIPPTFQSTLILEITYLSKAYGSTPALTDINLRVSEGKIIGLFGPNGCGKTTLIKIIVGLLRQFQGEVRIDGLAIGPATKAKVAYLPDRNVLNLNLNVNQCVRYFKDFFADFDELKARDILKSFQIPPTQNLKALSKGMIEKLHFALVLARNAQLYVLDEPIAGVDPLARDQVFEILRRYMPPYSSALLATHLLSVQNILDEAVFLHNGFLACHSPIEPLLASHGTLHEAYKHLVTQGYSESRVI